MAYSRFLDPNWVLVVVTSITAAFICWQSYETRRAANTSASTSIFQFRPRIILRGIHLIETQDEVRIELVMANRGEGIAHVIECSVTLSIVFTYSKPLELSTTMTSPFDLSPGEQIPVLISFRDRSIPYQNREDGRPSKPIRCEGLIRYYDENDTLRRTGFRRTYNADTSSFSADSKDPEFEYED